MATAPCAPTSYSSTSARCSTASASCCGWEALFASHLPVDLRACRVPCGTGAPLKRTSAYCRWVRSQEDTHDYLGNELRRRLVRLPARLVPAPQGTGGPGAA